MIPIPTYPARLVYSVLFFVLLITLIMTAKPRVLFDEVTGAARPFGVQGGAATNEAGPACTIFPLGVVVAVTAVLSTFVFTLIDVVFGV